MYDVLITGGHLLTMAGDGVGFVEDGAVAIDGRRIVAVGPRSVVEANDRARTTIDATNRLVMPGLIDAHTHSAATLARGLAQEVETWMGSAYGPLIRHATDDDAHLWTTSSTALDDSISRRSDKEGRREDFFVGTSQVIAREPPSAFHAMRHCCR